MNNEQMRSIFHLLVSFRSRFQIKIMINWRERYKESQMIQSTDTNVSTEVILKEERTVRTDLFIQRIRRLVTIYKKDLIEEDLHPYAQRLSNIVRCCQSCTPKSYVRKCLRFSQRSQSVCQLDELQMVGHVYLFE